MSNDELEFFQALSAGLGGIAIWATVAWLRARDRARAAEGLFRKFQQTEAEATLRRSVESIEGEVQRLGEGQKFLTQLLDQAAARRGDHVAEASATATPRK